MPNLVQSKIGLVELCEREVERCWRIARDKLGITQPIPRIRWDLRGGVAGRAIWPSNIIQLNPTILQANPDSDFVVFVPAHEVSHLVAHFKHGRDIKPHGVEWARCCWHMGIAAKRCHNYDIPGRATTKPVSLCQEIT